MSQPEMIVGYDVTVRGQYQSASGKDRILKTFGPATFFLPEYVEIPNGKKKVQKTVNGHINQVWEPQTAKRAVTVDNVALWVIQRRLLPTWLAEHHPDCTTFRTCAIVPGGMKRVFRPKSEMLDMNKSIDEMSIPELKHFCSMKQIAVPVSAFTDVKEAREAVRFELEQQGVAAPTGAPGKNRTDAANSAPAPGVEEAHGAVTDGDGVARDQQDPADDLI